MSGEATMGARVGTGPSLTHDVVVELQNLVFEDFPVGATLPSEATLAEQFGVSRLTIREALKLLAGRGLVDLRQGRRAVVTEPSSEVTSSVFASYVRRDPSALLELVEVRQALEVQSVRLAARRASRAGLAAIEASLKLMESSAREFHHKHTNRASRTQALAAYQAADVAFHESIALASGNRMLAHVLEALEESLLRSFHASFEGHLMRGGSALETYELHRNIYQFIAAGDSQRAAQAMRALLDQADRALRTTLSGSSLPPELAATASL
jgi:GntR family transcriptional repressor for pyruvate dehydrogenase complex